MLLQLKPLFMGETESLPIDAELDFSKVEFQGMYPFQEPVHVKGEAAYAAGAVTLRAAARFRFHGQCDRCTEAFTREFRIPVEHILVTSLNQEDNEDFVLLDNYQLKFDDLLEADILLELPSKNLCREDCRGLCPLCGKNLNDGACGCQAKAVDPRLEVLKEWLN